MLGMAGVAIVLALVALAPARSYRALRYDADVQVQSGGDLIVTETVVIQFEQGTFERFWRDLRTAKTDGIEVLDATLDGRRLPRGEGAGRVAVTGGNRIRVEWQLDPTGPSTHTFGLTYVARGVVRTAGGHDLLEWQPLPSEHRYVIDESRVTIRGPLMPADAPALTQRRTDTPTIAIENGVMTARATRVRSDGWISIGLAYPQGRLVQVQPRWEQRRVAIAAMGPRWLGYAGLAFAGGLALVLLLRGGYSSPQPVGIAETEPAPPGDLAPAMVAALLARGDVRGAPIATLLDLAQRGVIVVRELPRRFGARNFSLQQVPGAHDLAAHEDAAIRIAFGERPDDVSLARARGRLTRGGRRFSDALRQDLSARGLLDPARKAARDRALVAGFSLLVAGVVAALALVPLVERAGAWPMLIGLALSLSGVAGIVIGARTSALSDEGTAAAARWRAFKRHLKAVATGSVDMPDAPPSWTIYAAATGVGYWWARYLKSHPGAVPEWFAALNPADAGAAWVAFVGTAGAQSGAGATGGSGAAGGGGSGAA